MTALARPVTVADIIDEYQAKVAALDGNIAAFKAACTAMDLGSTVLGHYVENVFTAPTIYPDKVLRNLLSSAWKAIYWRVDVDAIASASDKKRFQALFANPPVLTMESAKAEFGDYLIRPRFHILRGLAEVFCSLDPAYKSHSKVKIGVKKLPKRIIIKGWESFSSGHAFEQFRNMANALAAMEGRVPFEWKERDAINAAFHSGEDCVMDGRTYVDMRRRNPGPGDHHATVNRGMVLRPFANGNVHVFFEPDTLRAINLGLAEFYGEALPDAEPEGVKPSASTAVAKDLQFYASPAAVIDAALAFADIEKGGHRHRTLEPSCGDGRILDRLRECGCDSLGIEYHAIRAAEASAKGHAVIRDNFLEWPASAEFDRVVMNPPFYGRHYAKHVRHAIKFLRPGGILVAVLPGTARYDHDELDDLKGSWRDLPVASFAESGTNIPTVLFRYSRSLRG